MPKVEHKQLQEENSASLPPSIQQQGENNDTAGAVLIFFRIYILSADKPGEIYPLNSPAALLLVLFNFSKESWNLFFFLSMGAARVFIRLSLDAKSTAVRVYLLRRKEVYRLGTYMHFFSMLWFEIFEISNEFIISLTRSQNSDFGFGVNDCSF